jgi:hypothetical protein
MPPQPSSTGPHASPEISEQRKGRQPPQRFGTPSPPQVVLLGQPPQSSTTPQLVTNPQSAPSCSQSRRTHTLVPQEFSELPPPHT